MGVYVEPPFRVTKQKWIEENGRLIQDASEIKSGEMMVVVVDNGRWVALDIAYNSEEIEHFTAQTDPRPRTCYAVKIELLLTVSGLEHYRHRWED